LGAVENLDVVFSSSFSFIVEFENAHKSQKRLFFFSFLSPLFLYYIVGRSPKTAECGRPAWRGMSNPPSEFLMLFYFIFYFIIMMMIIFLKISPIIL
jgi:hypothetical protein